MNGPATFGQTNLKSALSLKSNEAAQTTDIQIVRDASSVLLSGTGIVIPALGRDPHPRIRPWSLVDAFFGRGIHP